VKKSKNYNIKEVKYMGLCCENIISRQNALVVETHKLSDRKHRKALGLFRFDGVKLAAEAIARDVELTAILLRQSNAEAVAERITALAGKGLPDTARCVTVADHVFDSLTEENAPEGVICVAKLQSTVHTTWQDGEELPPLDEHIMLLESVRDPSNLGAIIRGAAALGVDRLILSADCADIYSAKTVRASMGTLFSQRIERTDKMVETIARLREGGRRVFAAALDDSAVRLGDFDVRPGDCAVIGNEGHGLSREVLAACDEKVYIPMTDRAESLNAAVAAALLMWEFGRKSR
jgi:TrmH family RNA methyltransferase